MRLSAAAGPMAFHAVRSPLVWTIRRPIRPRSVARLSLVNHLRRRSCPKRRGLENLRFAGVKIKSKGLCTAKAAIVGGNWNNDLQCGPFYANLNNTPSNSNSNNGAALSYPIRSFSLNAVHIAVKNSKRQSFLPHRLVKINSVQASASS